MLPKSIFLQKLLPKSTKYIPHAQILLLDRKISMWYPISRRPYKCCLFPPRPPARLSAQDRAASVQPSSQTRPSKPIYSLSFLVNYQDLLYQLLFCHLQLIWSSLVGSKFATRFCALFYWKWFSDFLWMNCKDYKIFNVFIYLFNKHLMLPKNIIYINFQKWNIYLFVHTFDFDFEIRMIY